MPVQNSPPAKSTRSQRNTAVLTPTARVPLDRTPSGHQLSENLDRGPPMEGAAPSRRSRSLSGLLGGYSGMSVGARAILGEVEDEGGKIMWKRKILGRLKWRMLLQMLQSVLKMMKQMTQLIGQLTQTVTPRDNSKAPAFKNPSMKAPDSFDGTQAHKLRGFIQSCQLIFHNDPKNFFSDRKKVLYSTLFLTGRAGKWIETYLSNISNEDPSYLLINWQFETQLFTLFGDPNEVRKAEQELDNLRIKESGHVSLPPQNSSSKQPHQKKNKKGKQFQSSKDKAHAALLNKDNKLIGSEKERRIKEGLCTIKKCFKRPQNKFNGIITSASNDFSTSVNSVALAGELKTPSLPSSVHIPSINPSQSLLPLRDEVCKEIKDVGKDVAISSLHLFQGDMDLPPLSFHASLEEQWDEEEDPE
ncbi:hypothetical protein O181_066968 [Austropuccinia psidii MF-1]|uniref:DUF4939 domain-containing protein n=1 Tax=Austropuccinia psidii MF-1 TaxID=1389203 RepID=A0A9Q3ESF9_9BASI|nr:hypothetical protein [Austropuccinia psidii MF-1]